MLENITVGEAWGYLLAAASALVLLGKAWDFIVARMKPNKDLRKHVEEHDRMLANDKRRLDEQAQAIQELKASDGLVLRSMLALIQHQLDGNGVDMLKRTRDDINRYLTERH